MNAALRTWRRRARAAALLALCLPLLALAWALWPSPPIPVAHTAPVAHDAGTVAHGRYLATLGNCAACHTARGGPAYGGGRGVDTPFGTVYSSNLTPSAAGLGAWSADDFWRALHHGQSRDGRWLYPAFPFNNTTHIARADSDALYAYLRQLPAVDTPSPAHTVGWPFNTAAAMKVWRALYFEAGPTEAAAPTPAGTPLERGAYLVRGLGHCSACHAPRNALGANRNMLDLAGGLIPMQNWYAPALTDPQAAGVQDWPLQDIVDLFRTGRTQGALVTGPMAEVVLHSTQHWLEADLVAMATYLQQLPRHAPPSKAPKPTALPQADEGARLYRRDCAQCHGEQGEGVRLGNGQFAYPPLAGNRSVTLASPANLVQTVLHGGFAPATAGHPEPFGMPPFVLRLNDGELAAVLTHLRSAWGHQAAPVSALDVQQLRGGARP